MQEETNAEATERISRELKAERKLTERKNFIMSMFFELTGKFMSEKLFQEYNNLFEKSKPGYNLKSFIRDKNLETNQEVRELSLEEFKKEQELNQNLKQ
jgi:hypothetical protein